MDELIVTVYRGYTYAEKLFHAYDRIGKKIEIREKEKLEHKIIYLQSYNDYNYIERDAPPSLGLAINRGITPTYTRHLELK